MGEHRMHTPVNYVEALKEHYGSMGFPPYQWTMNESVPLTPLTKMPVSSEQQ